MGVAEAKSIRSINEQAVTQRSFFARKRDRPLAFVTNRFALTAAERKGKHGDQDQANKSFQG
jgi:hypothetical protein